MGIYYSPADMSHPLSGAFVGTSYSVGLGLDVSPLSGVDVRLSDQIVIASEVRQIVKF